MSTPAQLVRDVGASLRLLRVTRRRTAHDVQQTAGVNLLRVETGRASVADMEQVANVLGTRLVDVIREVQSGGLPKKSVPPHTLTHVASAILSLPVKGSKVEAAVDAAVSEALRQSDGNQSAAARLLGMERKAFVRRLRRGRS